MDIDQFWAEVLAKWPALEARIESRRGPYFEFIRTRDVWSTSTTIWYRDGPPRSEMHSFVGSIGAERAIVIRLFSPGALMWALDHDFAPGTGLGRPPRDWDPDLTGDEVSSGIAERNEWARDSLPEAWAKRLDSDHTLRSALAGQQYPFVRYGSQPSFGMGTSQEQLPIEGLHTQEALWPNTGVSAARSAQVRGRTDGIPVLVNLTGEAVYLHSGEDSTELPEGPTPYLSWFLDLSDSLLVSAGEGQPVVQLAFGPGSEGVFSTEDVPPEVPGVLYLVPWETMHEFPHRRDFVTPCRWENGNVISMGGNPALGLELDGDPTGGWVLTGLGTHPAPVATDDLPNEDSAEQ